MLRSKGESPQYAQTVWTKQVWWEGGCGEQIWCRDEREIDCHIHSVGCHVLVPLMGMPIVCTEGIVDPARRSASAVKDPARRGSAPRRTGSVFNTASTAFPCSHGSDAPKCITIYCSPKIICEFEVEFSVYHHFEVASRQIPNCLLLLIWRFRQRHHTWNIC